MKEIKFYDVKGRKNFTTKKFIFKTERNPRTKKTTKRKNTGVSRTKVRFTVKKKTVKKKVTK